MSPSARKPKRSLVRSLCIVTAATILTGCASLTKPSAAPTNPLIAVSCPQLTPLTDDSFGATTIKLIEVAGQYRRCREAALALEAKK